MLNDRQEMLAMGELAVFLLAWVLGIFVAVGNHSGYTTTENALAESSTASDRPAVESFGAAESNSARPRNSWVRTFLK